ncbi:unnamed protein product [Arctogadus glacialis]
MECGCEGAAAASNNYLNCRLGAVRDDPHGALSPVGLHVVLGPGCHGDHPHLTVITNHAYLYIFPSHSTIRRQIVSYTYRSSLSRPPFDSPLLPEYQFLRTVEGDYLSGNLPDPPTPDRHEHSPLLCVAINCLIATNLVLSSFVPLGMVLHSWIHPLCLGILEGGFSHNPDKALGVCSALHQYYFVDKSLTWSDAQSHCRQYGGELATIHGPENQTRLVEVARKYNSDVWIGLYDDVKSWTWSLSENANYGGGEVEPWSWPWRGHEPNNDNRLSDSSFIYVHLRKSWWDAQSYCREHHTDLPSIRNMEENKLVYQIDTGLTWKWIGLHRNLWSTWSDGSNSSYRNWKDNRPPNRPAWTENNCTLALSNFGWQWADKQCNSKFKFLCNGVQVKQSFRIKLSSADIDPNDPDWSEGILKQLHGKLKEKMVNNDFNLTWTKAPDGEIFHNIRKDEKQQHPEFADERCPPKVD